MLHSQNYSSAIGAQGGITQEGYAGMLNYNYYTSRNSFIQAGLFFSASETDVGNNINVPFNSFTVQASYMTKLFQNRFKSFIVNVGGGPLAGYEIINEGSRELSNGAIILDKSKFIFGLTGSIELEKTLGDGDFSVLLKYSQFYHPNSDLGEFIPFLGIGIRYFLY